MRELRTHVSIAVLLDTGASTTYAPSAKAAAKLVIEIDRRYVPEAKWILRNREFNKGDPEYMVRPKVAITEKTKDNVLATMNASKAYLRASTGDPSLL
jgi:hypothetical protein